MSQHNAKTKTLLINLTKNCAIVFTDEGLIDASDYEAEWRLTQEDGDRTQSDYADYDILCPHSRPLSVYCPYCAREIDVA